MTVSAQGVKIINDAYNANPDSMKSALGVLAQQKGDRKIAVLGDMYELGCYEGESHVGRHSVRSAQILSVAAPES